MDVYTKASIMGFALVIFTLVAAILVKQFQSGRSGFGHLDKSIEVPVDRINLEFFKQIFQKRLKSLGFEAASGGVESYVQGGADLADFGAAGHAKTKKQLSLYIPEFSGEPVMVTLTLRYLDLVVVDTGESAYRDAVLDFVSGKTDEMVIVPNESLLALDSLIGGGLACVAAGLLMAFDSLTFWPIIPIVGVTEFAVGMLALFTISQRPAEITGRWKAIFGIILSLFAICASVYFIIATKSVPAS